MRQEHQFPLGRRWSVWRCAALRGAGMPIDWLAGLAAPQPDGLAECAARLRALAAEPLFREAVTWQNRHALHTGIDVLLASPQRRSSKYRQKEALIAGYLQRYCAKNDTIGFFGPVGWAAITEDEPVIAVEPGPSLLANRTVHFEGWCVDAITEVIARDESLLPWLPPRVPAFLRVEGQTVQAPLAPPATLRADEAEVMSRVDGRRTAREIALEISPADPEEVYGLLRKLRAARRIVWTLEVPADDPDPVATLRRTIDGVGSAPAREAAQRILDELDAHRRRIAAAAGDTQALDASMTALDNWFTALTGREAVRLHGRLYAGRTLVYEDCRRDVVVRLGPRLMDTLEAPLELLLTSARWFTERAIELYRDAILELYGRLAARSGPVVPLANLWLYAQDLLFRDAGDQFDILAGEVRQRWSTVLSGQAHEYHPEQLRDAVLDAFDSAGTTPGISRYCCPDVMIAATGVDAIRDGDYVWVLGELHAGFHTLASAFFGRQHPAPDKLVQAVERDLARPQIAAVFSREVPSRMMRGLISPGDRRVVYAQDSCGVPADAALPIASLVAERTDEGLEIRDRDATVRFEAMEFLAELVMVRAHRAFGIQPEAPHTPRLTFGRLVVEREKWRVAPRELAFAWLTDERERLRAARRWQDSHGMPRHVFVKTSRDAKPMYVDFHAPVFVDLLARTVRRSDMHGETVSVTEMLPSPDQAWLTDAQGRRYASELRLIAIEATGAAAA